MKESPAEPPLKKLKQARLPFQILSPPVVKNVETLPSQGKRKTCEATSDDDIIVCEVNENKIKPVEKKAKITNKNEDQEKERVDGSMEVKELEVKLKGTLTKEKKKTESNSSKKVNKRTPKRKSNGNNKNKIAESKNEKTNDTPVVLDCVDLCDSPVKTPCIEKEITNMSKLEGNTLVPDEGNQLNESLDCESVSSGSDPGQPKELAETIISGSSEDTCKSTDKANSEGNKSVYKPTSSNSDNNSDPQHNSTSSITDDSPTTVKSFKQPSISQLITSKSSKLSNGCDPDGLEESEKSTSDTIAAGLLSPTQSTDSSVNDANLKTPSSANDSMTLDDSSPSSDCNTPLSTPGSDPVKKTSKTPRRMTPRQLLKLKEKEDKRKEKERLKEEKEKKKAEEKEEKLKLKKEKEEEKLRLKQEKEDEKRREKEEKEKKKQAELDQKNEEKRLKEEEKRLKEEEKRAKDEEKRKKEEEERRKKEDKRLKEEQKEAEKRKSAQAFASFFVKTETKANGVEEHQENTPVETNFQPFEVKNDMKLAPLVRSQLPDSRRQLLDTALADNAADKLYLEQIHSPSYIRGSASRTWPPPDETDDEVIIVESEKPNEDMELGENEMEKKPEKRRVRAKLLQFHENRRPPYWGTWRKKSKHIRPRAPLNQDKTMLEYEVDSDDEWEEPEDGESLRGSDEEEEQDEQYEEDNDMFVPHGYLSDGEGEDELDDHSPESMKAKLKLLQMEFEAERKEKQEKLKPRLIGCVWFCNSEVSAVNGSKIAEQFLARRAVWEGSLPITVAAPPPSSPSTITSGAADTPGTESRSGAKKKVVKESLIPDIIRKMHGSRKKLSKLLLEFLEGWEQDKTEALPSKNCLAKRIRELAVWERPPGAVHTCWFVKEEVRAMYGLVDLDLPTPPAPSPSLPSPVANITKFTKVLTTDERLKLLRESPVAKEAPKEVPKTPSTSENSITPGKVVNAAAKPTPNPAIKTPTVKLNTSSPAVKKRVSLFSVGPKESPKPSATSSIMNFVTKSAKNGESVSQKQDSKVGEKIKKRITPITLTSSLPKSTAPASPETDCIILDD